MGFKYERLDLERLFPRVSASELAATLLVLEARLLSLPRVICTSAICTSLGTREPGVVLRRCYYARQTLPHSCDQEDCNCGPRGERACTVTKREHPPACHAHLHVTFGKGMQVHGDEPRGGLHSNTVPAENGALRWGHCVVCVHPGHSPCCGVWCVPAAHWSVRC